MAENEAKSVSGEVLADEMQEKLRQAVEKVQREGMITAGIAAKISRSPFFNGLTKKRIESAQEVVRAENAFMNDLRTHQLMKDRLLNLETDIAAQRREQQANLSAAEIKNLENEVKLEQLKAQLVAIKKANQEGGDEKREQDRYREQLDAASKRAAFEAELKVRQARERINARRMLAAERDRMISEIAAGAGGSLSPEQEFEIENIKDLFQTLMDQA